MNPPLILLDGTKLATTYNRIVSGARGDYVEFNAVDICEQLYFKFKPHLLFSLTGQGQSPFEIANVKAKGCYYVWLYPKGQPNVKIYYQLRTVGYADYKVGRFYIAPDMVQSL